jgi:2-oxoglutarate ferredoxin oxidoreductase subunit beta
LAVVCKTPRTIISATGFCAGCGHGIINRITAEALEELGVDKKTIMALGVGCCSLMGFNFGVDRIGSPHGRAPAVATGIKRLQPDKVVMTYQGDGDISSIGCAEIVHAAARNEKITTIFVNNGVYGMTGGQMAPTTLPNQVTTTSPKGRDPELTGMPIKITEMIAVLPVAYVARGSVHNPAAIRKAKGYIKQALQAQLNGEGFSMVEILSPCPTNWHLSPLKALERIENEVIPYYPMGELVKREGTANA